jgi:hypothetical protein
VEKAVDKEKFELLLKQKNHKEVILLLTKILEKFPETEESSIKEVLDMMKKYTESIPIAIVSIANILSKKLDELKNRPKENWEFTVTARDFQGNISTVTAKQK